MKRNIFLILLMPFVLSASAQVSFPEKCIGKWSGMMLIYQKGQLKDSVSVLLTVTQLDSSSWSWKTEYLSEKMPVTKDYILRCKDRIKNEYLTDEGDGITLNEYIFENKCYSVFETNGMILTSRYELITPDLLSFEVTSSKPADMIGAELRNYDMTTLQTVRLIKL